MTHTEDPFSGNWTLNARKSNFDPNHRPQAATMRWKRTEEGYRMRAEGQKEDGQTVVDQATFVLDGQEHPIAALPGATAFSERVETRTLRSIGRKNGQVLGEATYTVSEDGGTLTSTVRGVDAQERRFQTVMVWDRG